MSRINGPSESKEGIKVELLDVECREEGNNPDPEDIVDVAMNLAITNGSNQSVQFRPNLMRLIDSHGATPPWTSSSMPIPKGERRLTQVRFIDSRGTSCRDRMKVDFADSLTLGEPVQETPIGFIPEE